MPNGEVDDPRDAGAAPIPNPNPQQEVPARFETGVRLDARSAGLIDAGLAQATTTGIPASTVEIRDGGSAAYVRQSLETREPASDDLRSEGGPQAIDIGPAPEWLIIASSRPENPET